MHAEPTSGLDAATAKALVESLRVAAHHRERTVVATIHQPSWTLLCKFDSVVLLTARPGRGGTVIFDGPPAEIPGYFAFGGKPVPSGTNPADHLMYVVIEDGGDVWVDTWAKSPLSDVANKRQLELRKRASIISPVDDDGDDDASGGTYPISSREQYRVLLIRAAHMWVSDPQQGPLLWKLVLALSVVAVLLLYGLPNNLSKANGLLFYVISGFSLTLNPLVVIMPQERAVVLREYRNGVYSVWAYWLARVSLALGNAILSATVSTVFAYPLLALPVEPFPSKLLRWWLFQFMYVSGMVVLGLTLGMAMPSPKAAIKFVAAVLVPWMVTCGVTPPMAYVRPGVFWLHYPNLFSWALKLALTIGFTSNGDKASETLREDLGMHPGNANSCYLALAIIFLALFVIGLGVTYRVLNSADRTAGSVSPRNGSSTSPKASSPGAAQTEAALSKLAETDEIKRPLLNGSRPTSYGAGDVEGAVPSAPNVRAVPIELRGVTYRHAPTKAAAITDVSVRFEAGSVSVLMGPSGAGKTTLLNLLSGRLLNDGLEGNIQVDEKPANFRTFKRLGTLTPQDDILIDTLTVRQTLLYTAELRSPREWAYARKAKRVEAVMVKLGLHEKADNIVGNELKVGISGGQKKRLSIAMDLLADLPIVLLDEPTTGLDAAAALGVVAGFVGLAGDRTVICTIHQPPWATVLKFDYLVLLARGRLVFDGAPSELPNALIARGSPAPPNENPADFVMEILGDRAIVADWASDHKTSKPKTDEVPHGDPAAQDEDELPTYATSWFQQYFILLRRCTYVFIHDEDQFREIIFPSLIVATLLGIAFHNFGVNIYIAAGVLYFYVAHSILSANGCVLSIPAERMVTLREFRNGAYSVSAYFCARSTVSVITPVITGVPMVAIYYSLVGFAPEFSGFGHVYASSVALSMTYCLLAANVGLLAKTQLASAQIFAPIGDAVIPFAGVLIIKRFIHPWFYPLYYGLPIKYAFEIGLTAVLEHKGEEGADVLSYYNIHPNERHFNYMVLTFMFIAWFIIGLYVAQRVITGQGD